MSGALEALGCVSFDWLVLWAVSSLWRGVEEMEDASTQDTSRKRV